MPENGIAGWQPGSFYDSSAAQVDGPRQGIAGATPRQMRIGTPHCYVRTRDMRGVVLTIARRGMRNGSCPLRTRAGASVPRLLPAQPEARKAMSETANFYLTEFQVSERLQVTTRTLQRWRHTGGGPAYTRIGMRKIAYRVRDVEAWEASHRFAHVAAEMAGKLARVAG